MGVCEHRGLHFFLVFFFKGGGAGVPIITITVVGGMSGVPRILGNAHISPRCVTILDTALPPLQSNPDFVPSLSSPSCLYSGPPPGTPKQPVDPV